jgi:hypothetical protein
MIEVKPRAPADNQMYLSDKPVLRQSETGCFVNAGRLSDELVGDCHKPGACRLRRTSGCVVHGQRTSGSLCTSGGELAPPVPQGRLSGQFRDVSRRGKVNYENGSVMSRVGTRTQAHPSVVLLDDLMSDPKAQTGAEFRTSSEKRFKDTSQVFAGDSVPMIPYQQPNALPTSHHAQTHVASRQRRMGSIQDKIGNGLLNLAGPSVDFEDIRREICAQTDGSSSNLLLEHRQEFSKAVGKIETLSAVALSVKGKRLAGYST